MDETVAAAVAAAATPRVVREAVINIEKFNGRNFSIWKFQMTIMLRAKRFFKIVNGTNLKRDVDDEDEWEDQDHMCQSLICSFVEAKFVRQLMTCSTSSQMWRRLCTIHEQSAAENLQLLQQQFFDLRMKPEEDVADHISMIELLANQLTDLGETISEHAIVTKIIGTLTPNFRHMLSAWDSVAPELQTIDNLTLRLLKEESRNRKESTQEENSDKALFASKVSKGGSSGTPEDKKKRAERLADLKKTRCNYCRRRGHWERECEEKKKDESKNKSGANAATSDGLEDESAEFMVDSRASDNIETTWYADGGATEHMTDQVSWFVTIEEIPVGQWPVMVADNRKLWVRGIGDIKIKCSVNGKWENRTMSRVLYVPELRKNLFSVGQAADKGFTTTYEKGSCTVSDSSGRVAMVGKSVNKLYRLQIEVIQPSSEANIAMAITKDDPNLPAVKSKNLSLWHERFGHLQ